MRLIIDGFNKTINKRDNQIVIKEDGQEVDYFLPNSIQALSQGRRLAVTIAS